MTKSVAIIGSAWSGNKGAAAMLDSAVTHLTARHPGIAITHLSMYPTSDAALNHYPEVTVMNASPLRLGIAINGGALLWRIAPFLRSLIGKAVPEVRAIARADVLLDQGGITFVDGREKYLIYNIASILPALFVRTPVVKCAQALGPFRGKRNRFWARRFLPRVAAIVSRGAVTHDHLLGLGLSNVTAGADLAFTLPITEADREAARELVEPDFFASGTVVGVSPSQVLRKAAASRGEDYVGQVARQIDIITQDLDRPVLLIAHSARPNPLKLHNNDLPVCREIYERIAQPERVRFVDGEHPAHVLRALIGQCDLFVASRFHAMVSSLAMEVPTLVIGWSHKYREVLDMFDLASWATAADELTEELFASRMQALVEQAADVRASLRDHAPTVYDAAMGQLDVIDTVAGWGTDGS